MKSDQINIHQTISNCTIFFTNCHGETFSLAKCKIANSLFKYRSKLCYTILSRYRLNCTNCNIFFLKFNW